MEDVKDDIGQMFQKTFESHKTKPDPGDWEILAGSVQKINFFKFNPFQFNIYYASTILFCFVTCLGIGSHYTYSHMFGADEKRGVIDPKDSTNIKVLNNNSSIEDKSLHWVKDSIQVKTEKNLENIKFMKTQKQGSKQNMKETEDPSSLTNKKEIAVSVDTLQKPIQLKQVIFSADSSKLKRKRTLYVTKQDTIIQFDTLHAPKQKRRRF